MFRVTLPILLGMILVTPSCRAHFSNGIVEITNSQGNRTLHQKFRNGEIGKIGKGELFRAELEDGSTIVIWNKEATEPEEHK